MTLYSTFDIRGFPEQITNKYFLSVFFIFQVLLTGGVGLIAWKQPSSLAVSFEKKALFSYMIMEDIKD